ncbi:conserved hypothetical protein [Chloroherpeton thalassium ATCC 35110]|uniref:Uncharacterized protein n=1 Tax=Chloroherpeton thalassium (strain ATCC 35110 / GB-78) TaxID=517418 RepID=B3QZ94_CHLT3|nr:hypothetical protein [Chloroherpeton thalassium]ACF13787.1 conserved hypothetical protein [Chloroherpeton thalassium ATCC 35110]
MSEKSSSENSEQQTPRLDPRLSKLESTDPLGSIFPKTKKNKIAAVVFVSIISLFFMSIAVWINWPKSRPEAEPLAPAVKERLSRLPGGTNVLIYLGMKDIRHSDFWQKIIPDSIKSARLFADTSALGRFSTATGFDFLNDADTMIYAAQSNAARSDKFISIITGDFQSDSVSAYLEKTSENARLYDSLLIYRTDPRLWVSLTSPNELVLASSADMIEHYLSTEKNFFEADTLLTSLLERTEYKSHLWMALGQAGWATGAMMGLTAANKELKSMGNLRRIKQLVLAMKFGDGIKMQTEWVYDSRSSAFFASGLLWLALRVSGSEGTRLKESEKAFLNQIEMQQNLESIILRGNFSNDMIEQFRKSEFEEF